MSATAHMGVAEMKQFGSGAMSLALSCFWVGQEIHVMTCWFMLFHVMVVLFHDMLVHDFPCHGGLFFMS